MSHFPLMNCGIYLSEFNISGDTNNVQISRSQQDLDGTTFTNSGFKMRIPGLSDWTVGMSGLVELTDDGQDEIFHSRFALADCPFLVTLKTPAELQRCKFGLIQQGTYTSGGQVGGRAEWSAEGKVSNYVGLDGEILSVGAKTGTFNGTARQLGAVSATQTVYAQIHATAKTSFTSAVFKLQSDDNSGFTTPTDRITFTTITGLTSEQKRLVGPITDDYWRIVCSSFTGTSLTIICGVGIQ